MSTVSDSGPALNPRQLTVEEALWIVVAITFVGDVVTTFVGLQLGLVEGNPIADSAIQSIGILGLVGLKVFALGVAVLCRPLLTPEYRPIIPAALALPWGFAFIVNLIMLLTTV